LCTLCTLSSLLGDIQFSKNAVLGYQYEASMAGVGILGLGGR